MNCYDSHLVLIHVVGINTQDILPVTLASLYLEYHLVYSLSNLLRLGNNMSKGKTMVFYKRVTRLQVWCDFLQPVTTPYSWFCRFLWVIVIIIYPLY